MRGVGVYIKKGAKKSRFTTYTLIKCARCGTKIKYPRSTQKYCGSKKYKYGCSWKATVDSQRKWHKEHREYMRKKVRESQKTDSGKASVKKAKEKYRMNNKVKISEYRRSYYLKFRK